MAILEDQIVPYLGPGFCSSLSCKFFLYEPFHKPIEGCSNFEHFKTLKQSNSVFDNRFNLHYLWILLPTKDGDATISSA